MTINSEKDNGALEFDNNFFFFITKDFLQIKRYTNGTYKKDELISITTIDKF